MDTQADMQRAFALSQISTAQMRCDAEFAQAYNDVRELKEALRKKANYAGKNGRQDLVALLNTAIANVLQAEIFLAPKYEAITEEARGL